MPFSVVRALSALVVAVLLAVPHAALPAPPAEAMPVEGYPSYQPQERCSPRAKPGTLMLAEHLLRRYPGSGSSGISRSCDASGVSEHKEGRAFDWRLDATSARDQRYAADFLRRLTARDGSGNDNALARRMGIMYLIWDDRIWSASTGYTERPYRHASCPRRKRCSVTLRHRDHVHISLTRAAARARTSWYLRRSSAPAAPTSKPEPRPEPDPAPARPPRRERLPEGVLDLRRSPYTTVNVPANGRPVRTSFTLRGGVTYSLTAAGLYSYGNPRQVADAVCSWSPQADGWVPRPTRRTLRKFGRLTLLVDGKQRFDDECRRGHTYRTELTPKRDRKLTLRIAGPHRRSTGRLTVVVGRRAAKVRRALPTYPRLTPAPTATRSLTGYGLLAERVTLPADRGRHTVGSLEPGASYRVTVAGVVRLGRGVRSDGQCVRVRGTWYRSASIDPRFPGQDHGNLYVDGRPFSGRGAAGRGCSAHSHTTRYVADSAGRLRLDLWDPADRGDNAGELTVTVQRETPFATPAPAEAERPRAGGRKRWRKVRALWQQPHDWFEVDPASRRGTVSTMRLRRGEPVQVTVRGRFTSHGRTADASCVRTASGWARTDPDVLGQDPLELWVDGQQVPWRAVGATPTCSDEHRYTARFTATKPGPLRLAVLDLDHRDNEGTLEVTLHRVQE